ncbi:MAG TPA: adenylate/guanylate cyclase domain-containing protein [Actinomycetota bacterium]|nr:adenylate/guanylate cyclase domain-containing protein [Actinomycetota bacterium]
MSEAVRESIGLDELASRANVAPERVRELARLGLLEANGDHYEASDVGRIAVVEALVGAGVPLEDLAETAAAGVVSLAWFDGVLPPSPPLRDRTYREVLEELDLPAELVSTLFEIWGVTQRPLDERIREDDDRLFRVLAPAYEVLGRDDERFLEATRYFGDNARRTAEAQIAFYQRGILEPLLASGLSLKEVVERINPITNDVMRPGVNELLLWLNRRHVDALNTQMLVQLVESALLDAGVQIAREQRHPAIAFFDLSGYTRLTDEGGDEQAVSLTATCSDLIRSAASRFNGVVVKLLGDGVMLQFPDPADAVRCALFLLPQVVARGLPPAHIGIHAGPVVFRDGDYFGRTVNLASRITDYARPGEVLVSASVVESVGETEVAAFQPIGPVALKGIAEPTVLYAATDPTMAG